MKARLCRLLPCTFSALSVFLLSSLGLLGQSYYGSLRGTVYDQNGGAISGAKVSMVAEGTGATRSTLSTGAGEFVFTEVIPASYTVTVETPGFKKFERKGIAVGTQQQLSIDTKLEVGEVTQ